MKKRLQIIISFFLIFILLAGAAYVPASSYENDIETSTADILLINLDTNTTVYSKKPDNKWYSGDLAALMTYLLAYENIDEPDKTVFEVEQDFIDELPYSDGCLDDYAGEELTAKDLMAIALLTSGNDAAYALAYLVNGSDLSGFIDMMNERAEKLGCVDTIYVTPGYSDESAHHTTCRDLAKLYIAVRKTDIFNEIMNGEPYIPSGLDEDYAVVTEASIFNSKSPYYFRYTNDAKFSYSEKTYAGLVLTTTYHEKTYLFVGLLGLNESEKNVYADARSLITWAYLNLSDRKLINSDDDLTTVKVDSGWGEYDLLLFTADSAYKTLPNDFDEKLLSFKADYPETVKLPLTKGQKIGKATLSYNDEVIDAVDLVVDSDEGLDMLNDSARFANYVVDGLFSIKPTEAAAEAASEETE